MPDTRKHRGPGPEDPTWFGPGALAGLQAAVDDFSWLLSRGYAEASGLKLVGDRYRLVERQRVAVLRSSCSDQAHAGRQTRRVEIEALRGRAIRVDAFNLILTLESALGGAVLLRGRDGALRDLASVHGSYRRVAETAPALALARQWLGAWGIGPVLWLVDAPVSNSGRIASLIRAADPSWSAEVVPDPDPLLMQTGDPVATADSRILDGTDAWVSLADALVRAGVPRANIVDFAG